MILLAAVCLSLLSPDFLICREEGKNQPVQICITGEPCKTVKQAAREWRRKPAKYRADMGRLYGEKQ